MATLQSLCIFHFALFAILNSAVAVTKEYYIGAVDVMWDYAPSDINQKTAVKLDDDEYVCQSTLIFTHPVSLKRECNYLGKTLGFYSLKF